MGRNENKECFKELFSKLDSCLRLCNPYVQQFRSIQQVLFEKAAKVEQEQRPIETIRMVLLQTKADPHCYNEPTRDGVFAIFVGEEGVTHIFVDNIEVGETWPSPHQEQPVAVRLWKITGNNGLCRGNSRGQALSCRTGNDTAFDVLGSPRNMQQGFQDSMELVQQYDKLDYFITFMCNPNWIEIIDALKTWETRENRPDLVSRVFRLKLKEFLDDILKKHIFGIVFDWVYVIEYQKSGLP